VNVIVRPVTAADESQLLALADLLDTVNLPDDPVVVRGIITKSERAFAALAQRDPSFDHRHAHYTLVAVEDGKLLGTASLFAFHGMPEEPHFFLRVEQEIRHSTQLNTDRSRTLLKLGRDIEPWTELGGLVVHPESRGKGVGKLLLAARLLLVAMHRGRFCDRLLAELLPPRRADGGNAFWDAVGGPLTGLDYYRADLLCRTDKEFIDAFFPHDQLVAELLPPAARELIGREGEATTPVRALLKRAGFAWLGTIDPFDAGPHDGAEITAITPIQRTRELVLLDNPPESGAGTVHLVATAADHVFRAQPCVVVGRGLRLADASAQPGDPLWVMPLDW
jgi:arginine N-succinyltransferase